METLSEKMHFLIIAKVIKNSILVQFNQQL